MKQPAAAITPKTLFTRQVAQNKEKNKFKCTVYYCTVSNINCMRNPNIVIDILYQANIPVTDILYVAFPYNNLKTFILYFHNCHIRNKTKEKLQNLLSWHGNVHVN
jgi:hypothetical protein